MMTSCFADALEDLERLDLLTEYLEPPRIGDQLITKASSIAAVDPRGDLLNDALADLLMEGRGDTLNDDLGDLLEKTLNLLFSSSIFTKLVLFPFKVLISRATCYVNKFHNCY